LAEWYIYQATGNPAGPFSTDLLAMGVAAGKVSRDAYVARQGDPQWTEIMQVLEVGAAVHSIEAADGPPPSAPINTVPPAPPPLKTESPTIVLPLFVPGAEGAEAPPEPVAPVLMGPPINKDPSSSSEERLSHPTWGKAPVSTEKLVASWNQPKIQQAPVRKASPVVPIIIIVACCIAAAVSVGVWRSMSGNAQQPAPATSK